MTLVSAIGNSATNLYNKGITLICMSLESEGDIFSRLSKFSLSPYEISVYKALLLNGPLTATGVVKLSGIPQPRVYDVFSNLEKKGMITTSSGMKKVYKAIRPNEALSKEVVSLSTYVTSLDNYVKENMVRSNNNKPNVWILDSKSRTSYSIEEMLEKAEKEVIICTSYKRLRVLLPKIKTARERGVTICTVIFSDSPDSFIERLSQYSIVKKREGFPPEIIISDRESALINVSSMLEDARYSILIDESELIHIITYYFYYVLWEPARYVSDFTQFRTLKFSTSWLACECIDSFLQKGYQIHGDLYGYIGKELIEISGTVTKTDRVSGIRHGFIINSEDKNYSVGGKNAKLEDVRMLSLLLHTNESNNTESSK